MKIGPPDIHLLNAAEGWLGLGNTTEAHRELDAIKPALRKHPSVLKIQWEIFASEKRWVQALGTAELMIRVAPRKPDGWINQSYCLHELKRTREAWDRLLPVAGKFPAVSTIPYNLACYACQMGKLDDADVWLGRAIEIGGKGVVTRMALSDPDLSPLWDKIRTM